jgi:hypothetical protein
MQLVWTSNRSSKRFKDIQSTLEEVHPHSWTATNTTVRDMFRHADTDGCMSLSQAEMQVARQQLRLRLA